MVDLVLDAPRRREAGSGRADTALTAREQELLVGIPPAVEYVPHLSFAAKGTEARLFGRGAEGERVGKAALSGARLSRAEEEVLFLRYNYAKYRLSRLVERRPTPRSETKARAAVYWRRMQLRARAELTQANLALVTAMAQRAHVPHAEFGDLISEGNLALLRSIERFDVSRGFKFSTYACRAILKSFSRLARRLGRYRQRFPVEFDPDYEQGDHLSHRREADWSDALEDLREVLAGNLGQLTDLEQRVLWERFFDAEPNAKRTLAEVGRSVGFSTERVRQIQHQALRKVRVALAERGTSVQSALLKGRLRKRA